MRLTRKRSDDPNSKPETLISNVPFENLASKEQIIKIFEIIIQSQKGENLTQEQKDFLNQLIKQLESSGISRN